MRDDATPTLYFDRILAVVEGEEAKSELSGKRDKVVAIIEEAMREGMALGVEMDAMTHSTGGF